jgi:putative pyruvate formate lyase activating enzyme
VGRLLSPRQLADRILKKYRQGAHSLGWVTPTPQIIGALEAYQLCLQEGCNLPLVHNGGGYESPEIIRLLEGIVDIWLPDAKTADPDRAAAIQDAGDYPEHNLAALSTMVEQVDTGHARAVIVRHLILPGGIEDSRQLLSRLWERFSNRIYLSLMVQYFPTWRTENHDILGRRLTVPEYEDIVAFAQTLGFRKGWVQQCAEEGTPSHCLA